MPYTPLAPRRWNSSKFLRWRRGALCLTNFLPLPNSLTTSSSSSLVWTGRLLHTRRGALFLINFLTKVAILGAPTEKGRSPSCKGKPCAPAPLSCPRRLLTSIYAGAFSSPTPEERGWLLMSGGETLYTNGYCHYLPAVVHKMDTGSLAQQSDVSCKNRASPRSRGIGMRPGECEFPRM